jgi:hypothetical protein
VLAQAITRGCDAPVNDYLKMTNRTKVVIRDIDPKAVSTQDLYGFVNMATREWKVCAAELRVPVRLLSKTTVLTACPPVLRALPQDGLLSYTMRELANTPDNNPKWILLDGDLDANWVRVVWCGCCRPDAAWQLGLPRGVGMQAHFCRTSPPCVCCVATTALPPHTGGVDEQRDGRQPAAHAALQRAHQAAATHEDDL